MALSVALPRNSRSRGHNSYKVTDAVQVYAGSLVGIDNSTGYLVKWADVANYLFKGVADRSVLGETSDSPVPEAEVNEEGVILNSVTVIGVTAITNIGDLVYATDDNTFTLSVASNVVSIGHIVRWHSSTTCDVQLYTPGEYLTVLMGSGTGL